MKVCDAIVQCLENHGVKHVFTVVGGGSLYLTDALARSSICTVHCHHEQAAAMAAETYGKLTGLGVVLVTTGPGGTNAITGVAGAWLDSVPVLVISGQVYLSQTIAGTKCRQIGVQELNVVDIAKPVTKYAKMVTSAHRTVWMLEHAIECAQTGRKGPVWLDIPVDIQTSDVEQDQYEPMYQPMYRMTHGDTSVQRVAELLKQSKRPLMHIGNGAREVFSGLIRIADMLDIPFVLARNAVDAVSHDHRLYMGCPGTWGQRAANKVVQECDLYIAIGTRLSYPQTGFGNDYAKNATKVVVDIDASELYKGILPIDLKIQADAKEFVSELSKHVTHTPPHAFQWWQQCNAWKDALVEEYPETEYVNSYQFIQQLSNICTEDDIIVTDMGLAFHSVYQAWKTKLGQRILTSCGLCAMGSGLPGAIGAYMATGRRVILIVGDGGMQMNVQELATVAHHNMNIKIFLFDNGGYLTLKESQERSCEGRLVGCDADSGISFPDWEEIAKAYGIGYAFALKYSMEGDLRFLHQRKGHSLSLIDIDINQPQQPRLLSGDPFDRMWPYD